MSKILLHTWPGMNAAMQPPGSSELFPAYQQLAVDVG